ncbi:MAG: 5'-nucleotidase C-terminal domain-containing protein [Fimbriimonadaceae bacterium]|nr:5'-nucleotidase C-terminal domain-containing protein [Fimbriimonadaceae bacterium]
MKRSVVWICAFTLGVAAFAAGAADDPALGSHLPAQAAADLIRETAGTDGAFLAAGLLKEKYDASDASSMFQYPTDEIVIVTLTGNQIRAALERSVSLYPQPYSSFLQLSGFTATFSKSAASGKRLVSVATDGGAKVVDGQSYTVAMPASLGRGGLGYFKIWDKPNITRTLSDVTIDKLLKGKRLDLASQSARVSSVD